MWKRSIVSHPNKDQRFAASTGADDKLVRVWSVGNGRLLQRLASHAAPVLCLALSPSEKLLFSGSQDATVRCAEVLPGNFVKP